MERKLPVYEIEGALFTVEVDHGLLRNASDSSIVFGFSAMDDKGSHYELFRDGTTNMQIDKSWLGIVQDYRTIEIPQMVKLDPEGISLKFGLEKDKLPKRDADLACSPELLAMREKGTLPTIAICGHTFYIDMRMGLLRPKDDFSTQGIPIDGLTLDWSGSRYVCLYHKKNHGFYETEWDKLTKIPRHVVPIALPLEEVLDPYYVAKRDGWLDMKEMRGKWFNEHPVRYNLEAQVLPWSETTIPEIIKENRQRIRQENSAKNRNNPGKGQRF